MGIFDMGDGEYSSAYAEEAAMVDASELIANALERSRMTRNEFASALGTGEVEVIGFPTGGQDITVGQLARTLHVLGGRLELTFLSPDRR